MKHPNTNTSAPRSRPRPRGEEGTTPVELVVFIPVIAVIAALGVFWSGANDQPESFYAARNIAEIRASHPPERARQLEERYLTEIASETGGCAVTPPAEIWYRDAAALADAAGGEAVETGTPVTVRVTCREGTSSWTDPSAPGTPEPVSQLATSQAQPGCVTWGC